MISGISIQDTVKPAIVVRIKTDNLLPDSVFRRLDEKPAFMRHADSGRLRRSPSQTLSGTTVSDTTSVCTRNSIADVTFYDSLNFISGLRYNYHSGPLPFKFAGASGADRKEQQITIITDLKDGIALPRKPIHNDWIIIVIFFAAYLLLLVRSSTRSIWPEVARFFMLRGINESSSRDTASLFYWRSTILNLISFILFGLFAFCAAAWYDLIPAGVPPLVFLIISFGIIVVAITSRHMICIAAGRLSSQTDVFNEYLVNIYQSYRFCSILFFMLIVALAYTTIFSPQACFIAGVIVFGVFYFYRVLRLLLIFIKKDIPILYLILYLCALEILPVLILVKYFTSLV